MALNTYFTQGTASEQNLYADIIIEAIKIFGHNVYYLPRKIVNEDGILNEDVISRFDDAFVIEMYMDSIDSYEGDGKFISKFGLEFRDQIGLVCARRRWNQLISTFGYANNSVVPREGDLIYFPMLKTMFEIKYTDTEKVFYQLKNLPTFRLTCEVFEYRDQSLNTGITEIDNFEAKLARTIQVLMLDIPEEPDTEPSVSDATRQLELNESLTFTLPSGVTGTSEILSLSMEDDGITVRASIAPPTFDDGMFHKLVAGTTIVGDKHLDLTSVIMSTFDLDSDNTDVFENDLSAQNTEFEQEGNDFIDFTESNPFGEPNIV
jgi:hypothetical protein